MIKLFEAFAGYGTSSFAFKQLGIEHELVGFSEIDKYAVQCFEQNHGSKNYGDIKLINPNDLPDFDFFTGGFPCQSFSNAGKMLGELDSRGTLFYEIIRICEVKQPKYILLENVKGLTSKKFKDTFNKIISELNRIGYNVYWKVLNTKDYGIPQSRARVWFVCFRKDIDKGTFQFPTEFPLKIFIKDILEQEVDSKYYLSPLLQERFAKYLEDKNNKLGQDQPAILDLYNHKIKTDGTSITLSDPCHNNLRLIEGQPEVINLQPRQGKGIGGKGIISKNDGPTYCLDSNNSQGIVAMRKREQQQNLEPRDDGYSNSLTSVQKDNLVAEINVLGSLDSEGWEKRYEEIRRIYETNGIMCTLPTGIGDGVIPKILDNNVPMILGYTNPNEPHQSGTVLDKEGICNTLYAQQWKAPAKIIQGQLRRLTPKECFRLQGFLNDEINLDNLSDTQKYKLAGNGQSVNVVKLIIKEMLK